MVGALLNPLSGRSLKGFVFNLRRSAEGSVADLDLDEGAGDCRPNGLFRLLAGRFPVFRRVWLFAEESANGLRFR
jgi:hypothetical protein